jgi:hypothetical protein
LLCDDGAVADQSLANEGSIRSYGTGTWCLEHHAHVPGKEEEEEEEEADD